jgi:6-phosphofructokinase 1
MYVASLHLRVIANRNQHRKIGKRKTIIIVAEGAHDQHGVKITAQMINDLCADPKGLNIDTRISTLGHVQRGGPACAYDRMLSTIQGVDAVHAVLDATPDTETPFIAINENKIIRKPLVQAVLDTKEVAKAIEARDFDRAMSLRDTEFSDFYKSFMMTTATDLDETMKLPPHKVSNLHICLCSFMLISVIAYADWYNSCWCSCWRDECSYTCGRGILHWPWS